MINQQVPYNGPILSGTVNYFKWSTAVTRYLTAMKLMSVYLKDLGKDWEKTATDEQRQDQKAAIAQLGFFVEDHVYNLYLEPAKTAPMAWKNLISAFGTKDHHQADALKEKLRNLKFSSNGDPNTHIIAMEELICSINSHLSEPLSERDKIYRKDQA